MVSSSSSSEEEAVKSSVLPENNRLYGTKEYWDERFRLEDSYEWLVSYDHVQQQLNRIIPSKDCRIVIIGCGNSPFSHDMYRDGYHNIVNLDYSSTVIAAMQEKYRTTTTMEWRIMDMTDMSALDDSSFDVVIDKAAMDAILTNEKDVWYPHESMIQASYQICSHISRILKNDNNDEANTSTTNGDTTRSHSNGGIYLQISFAQPHFRTKYLLGTHYEERILSSSNDNNNDTNNETSNASNYYSSLFGWTLDYETVGAMNTKEDDIPHSSGGFNHFLYIMKKTTVNPKSNNNRSK